MGLGALTPLFVLIFNTLGWSFPAYAYFRLNGERPALADCSSLQGSNLLAPLCDAPLHTFLP